MGSAYPLILPIRKLKADLIYSTELNLLNKGHMAGRQQSKEETLIPAFDYSNAFLTRLCLFLQ